MSAAGTIAKLEALLARVRTRTGEPRIARAVAAQSAVSPPAAEPIEDEDSQLPTIPPPPVVAAPAPALDLSVDIDVEEPAVTDAPPAPPAPVEPAAPVADALSSQERLVVGEPVHAEAASLEPLEQGGPAPGLRASPEPAAEPEIEEPPASSRRPLAPQPEERLDEMAFGTREPRPPLHTPPPESGRLPAAPEVEFPEEDTGVHAAAPPVSTVIAAEPTRGELSGAGQVAAIQGGLRSFQPASFAELLDASLGL